MLSKKYKFQNAEIGVMTEIMLPKKIQYQGFLFKSLISGLKDFSFQNHYAENRESIESLLSNYGSLITISNERLSLFDEKYKDIFKGYSMYEVDGVFKFRDNSDANIKFSEERTQIVKVYYIPEYSNIKNEVEEHIGGQIELETIINFADLFFMNAKITSYRDGNIWKRLQPLINDEDELIALGFLEDAEIRKKQFDFLKEYFTNWVDAIAFFTFGYVVWMITDTLVKMKSIAEVSYLEEEIWVASQWGVLINRTILEKQKDLL